MEPIPPAQDPRDADGVIRRGRTLRPRQDRVWVSRGTCSACGQHWIGFASRRAYSGHASALVTLPCPGCLAPDRVPLTKPELGGVELHLATRLPRERRRWLDDERRESGGWPSPFTPIGLIAYALLGLAGLWIAASMLDPQMALTMIATGAVWVGFIAGVSHPRWESFRCRHPFVAWPLQGLGLVAAVGVIPGMIVLTARWGW